MLQQPDACQGTVPASCMVACHTTMSSQNTTPWRLFFHTQALCLLASFALSILYALLLWGQLKDAPAGHNPLKDMLTLPGIIALFRNPQIVFLGWVSLWPEKYTCPVFLHDMMQCIYACKLARPVGVGPYVPQWHCMQVMCRLTAHVPQSRRSKCSCHQLSSHAAFSTKRINQPTAQPRYHTA